MPVASTRSSIEVASYPRVQNAAIARSRTSSRSNCLTPAIAVKLERSVSSIMKIVDLEQVFNLSFLNLYLTNRSNIASVDDVSPDTKLKSEKETSNEQVCRKSRCRHGRQ